MFLSRWKSEAFGLRWPQHRCLPISCVFTSLNSISSCKDFIKSNRNHLNHPKRSVRLASEKICKTWEMLTLWHGFTLSPSRGKCMFSCDDMSCASGTDRGGSCLVTPGGTGRGTRIPRFFLFLNFNSLRKKQRITEGCSRGTQRGQGRSLWMFRDSNGYTTDNEVSRGRFVGLGHSCISVAQRPSNGPAPRAQKRQKI